MTKSDSYNSKLLLNKKKYIYPLLENALDKTDLNAAKKVIKSGFITMNKHTSTFEKKFETLSSEVTSNGSTSTSPSISSLSFSRFCILHAQITKLAPAADSVLAKCLPRPEDAPVTIAVFPSKLNISFIIILYF